MTRARLTGTHTFTVEDIDPHGHPFQIWSTGETSRTITVSSAGTYTACYYSQRTIKICASDRGMCPNVPIVVGWKRVDDNYEAAGFYCVIGVIANKSETEHIITSGNGEDGIEMFVVLWPGDSGTVAFLWNETDPDIWAGIWSLRAYLGVVSPEVYDQYIENNRIWYSEVIIYGTGDVAIPAYIHPQGVFVPGDGRVNIYDVVRCMYSTPSLPGDDRWNWYADVNCDGKVDIFDWVTTLYLTPHLYDP